MNVLITYADGKTFSPVYEPSHKDSLIEFYTALVNDTKQVAMSVRITDDNGELVWFGSAS